MQEYNSYHVKQHTATDNMENKLIENAYSYYTPTGSLKINTNLKKRN